MQANIGNDVMPSVGRVVTLYLSDVSCVSSVPVVVKGCINLGCCKPSIRSSKYFIYLYFIS
jgi:hypothetical protein